MKSHTSLFIKLGLACHYKKNENAKRIAKFMLDQDSIHE